jgi:hypothetical protein
VFRRIFCGVCGEYLGHAWLPLPVSKEIRHFCDSCYMPIRQQEFDAMFAKCAEW